MEWKNKFSKKTFTEPVRKLKVNAEKRKEERLRQQALLAQEITEKQNQQARSFANHTTRSFERFDELIQSNIEINQKIGDILVRLNALEQKVSNLPSTGPSSKQADSVLDTLDQTYKDVKDIAIKRAYNADKVLDNGIYVLANQIKPSNSSHADRAAIADQVVYNNGTHSMDTIMYNYIAKISMRNILVASNDFDSFKRNLLGITTKDGGN